MQNTTQAAFGQAVDQDGVFALVGDYDIFSSRDLASQIDSLAQRGARLFLDFTRCTYIDSSILTVLVRAVRNYGDTLQMIVPPQGNVARILSITQLDQIFPIVTQNVHETTA